MFKTALKLIAADIALVVAEVYVIQDLQWRSAYAATARQVCGGSCSYTPSFSYGFLTQFFTMTGSSAQLTSPPTLDWVQALAVILVVVNAWFLLGVVRKRRARLPDDAHEGEDAATKVPTPDVTRSVAQD